MQIKLDSGMPVEKYMNNDVKRSVSNIDNFRRCKAINKKL
ncbi:hypothetical protein DSUL_20432 [Desulfovibrionales bacterium]